MTRRDLQFFGSLEGDIVRILWVQKKATVREVLNILKKDRPLAYTTVMTVMNRLVVKKLLTRRIQNGANVYFSAYDEESFFRGAARRLLSHLSKEFGQVAISQFVDAFEEAHKKKTKNL